MMARRDVRVYLYDSPKPATVRWGNASGNSFSALLQRFQAAKLPIHEGSQIEVEFDEQWVFPEDDEEMPLGPFDVKVSKSTLGVAVEKDLLDSYPEWFSPTDAQCALLDTVEEEAFGKTYILRERHSGKVVTVNGLDFFFVDTAGIKQQLENWLQENLNRRKGTNNNRPDLLPLFINGMVKTGKTTVLFSLIPAIIGGHPELPQSGASHEICRIDLLSSCSSGTYKGVLQGLLDELLKWASKGKKVPDTSALSDFQLQYALERFFRQLPRLTFFLLDEIQTAYRVEEQFSFRMRVFWKTLLQTSGMNAVFALTGSNLAYFWLNISETPTNGRPLQLHHRCLSLPCSAPVAALHSTWKRLLAGRPTLPPTLQSFAPLLPALAVHIANTWHDQPLPLPSNKEAWEIQQSYEEQKLTNEIHLDLGPILPHFSQPERKALWLVVNAEGCVKWELPWGLKQYFGPYLQEGISEEYVRLDAPWHVTAIQKLLDKEGNIRSGPLLPTSPERFRKAIDTLAAFGGELHKKWPK